MPSMVSGLLRILTVTTKLCNARSIAEFHDLLNGLWKLKLGGQYHLCSSGRYGRMRKKVHSDWIHVSVVTGPDIQIHCQPRRGDTPILCDFRL